MLGVLKNYKFSIILLAGVLVGGIAGTILWRTLIRIAALCGCFSESGVLHYRSAGFCVDCQFDRQYDELEKARKNSWHLFYGDCGYGLDYCRTGADQRAHF